MKYERSTSYGSKVKAKVKVFRKAGQKVTVKVTRSSTSISLEKISLGEYTCQILVFSIYMYLLDLHGFSRVMTLVKVIHMKIKGQGHKSKTFYIGLITRNVHMKYESSTSNG